MIRSATLILVSSALFGLSAVSGDSLWIDEGLSATKAIAPTVGAAWQELLTEGNTNMHMLLYMFSLWSWEKLFGSSEWALRAMNIPFFILGVASLWFAVSKAVRPYLLAFCLSSPFLWFYLNDARPYTMVFGLSAVVTACIVFWSDNRLRADFPWTAWAWTLSASCVLLVWTHVVGLVFEFWAAAMLLALAGPTGISRIVFKAPLAIVTVLASNVALLAYILWTKNQGVDANPLGSSGFLGALFCIYEFGGFAGLGPDRSNLRTAAFEALKTSAAPLVLLAVTWASVLFFAWRSGWVHERRNLAFTGLFLLLLPVASFLLLGHLQGTRFVPRHATVCYPAFSVIAAAVLSCSWKSGMHGKIAVGALIALMLTSSLSLRFSPQHRRDDYRNATAQALESLRRGAHVWWGGDIDTARYYGMANPKVIPRELRSFETAAELRAAPGNPPDVVYLSKVDIYDPDSAIRNYVQKRGYQRTAGPKTFTIWTKPDLIFSP